MMTALEAGGRGDPSRSVHNAAVHFLVLLLGDDTLLQEGVVEVSEPQLLVLGLVLIACFVSSHKLPPFP